MYKQTFKEGISWHNKISPRGKSFWNSQLDNINWHKAWLCPFKFCISNKIREIHWKILHNIYPCNKTISMIVDIDVNCSFCKVEPETVIHLFYHCPLSFAFWTDLENFIFSKTNFLMSIIPKDVITLFESDVNTVKYIVNLAIAIGKFHIQCLAKVFIALELFHILSRYKHKLKYILLGFYVIDQHKVVHNCEVKGK